MKAKYSIICESCGRLSSVQITHEEKIKRANKLKADYYTCDRCMQYRKNALEDIEMARLKKIIQIENAEHKKENPVITKWEDPFLSKSNKINSSLFVKRIKYFGTCECGKYKAKPVKIAKDSIGWMCDNCGDELITRLVEK